MTALPVSWDVEGKLFSGTKLLCYLCVWAVSSKPKSLLSISPKTKTKNFPGPRAGGLQIATRKNWMDEQITPEYSYCKWKQGMGQGWGERKGKKTYQSHICHWLNGKGDYKDIFIVWNDRDLEGIAWRLGAPQFMFLPIFSEPIYSQSREVQCSFSAGILAIGSKALGKRRVTSETLGDYAFYITVLNWIKLYIRTIPV